MWIVAFLIAFAHITGGTFAYTVQPGDSLTGVSARFGVDVEFLAETNGLDSKSWLSAGQTLYIDNRHIAPESRGAAIVINVPQRMLFYYEDNIVLRHYPIASGKPGWQTPLADFSIIRKERNPTWDVPPSIQEEMRRSGKPVLTCVPPSPQNPLGKYWLGLSVPGVGIHGTNVPSSIYKTETHGCIRLHPNDIEDLFALVDTGTTGRFIYEPVLIGRVGNSVFLEVHRDVYRKGIDPLARAQGDALSQGFFDLVDWSLAREVILNRDGIAREVTRKLGEIP
jgi:L,D-transpeptidase ErfK/SrfK